MRLLSEAWTQVRYSFTLWILRYCIILQYAWLPLQFNCNPSDQYIDLTAIQVTWLTFNVVQQKTAYLNFQKQLGSVHTSQSSTCIDSPDTRKPHTLGYATCKSCTSKHTEMERMHCTRFICSVAISDKKPIIPGVPQITSVCPPDHPWRFAKPLTED